MIYRPVLLVALHASLATAALAQEGDGKAPIAGAGVTLDQLSTTSRARTAGSVDDLDVTQPPSPTASAKVTSAEVSTRAEGRALATAPLAGSDSCDPAKAAAHSALCRQRLEARANTYSRPGAAPVTPEGRLLLLINPINTPALATVGGRQLDASGLNDANGPAEQLAGALQDRATQDKTAQDAATSATKGGAAATLPAGVPPVVVLPR